MQNTKSGPKKCFELLQRPVGLLLALPVDSPWPWRHGVACFVKWTNFFVCVHHHCNVLF